MHELIEELRERYGVPALRVQEKRQSAPNKWLVDFVAATTLLLIGSNGPGGKVYMSPRGGAPGFLKLIDGELCFREAAGNNLFESLSNIAERHAVGLLLVVPGLPEMVRAFGTARVLAKQDDRLFAELAMHFENEATERDLFWRIHLTEWYYHCGRAAKRSRIFDGSFVREHGARNALLAKYARSSGDYLG